MIAETRLPNLINALMQPAAYAHAVRNIELIETHISWVILTGDYAYKIKKPVNFGFLDFSSLQKRHQFCNEELRLNRRLAPAIYLDVVSITGTEEQASVAGEGDVIEYAVKMKQFPQDRQLDHMLERGELSPAHVDVIAEKIAAFHRVAGVAGEQDDYGNPAAVYMPIEENFSQIRQHVVNQDYLRRLDSVEAWSRESFDRLNPLLQQRKAGGFIRECHGDLHLRNLVWYENEPLAFDCIEFNPGFRWIDVISEIAFLVMDLQDRLQPQLAQRFLNRYLELTGDYQALALLSFYCCYRAMVRAKVAALRLSQAGLDAGQRSDIEKEFAQYLQLAEGYSEQKQATLVITFGMSASGKSTVSRQLLEMMPAIRLRSDVERKRLHGIDAKDSAADNYAEGIYSVQASLQTYKRLLELAACVLDAGYSVIIDAANLKYELRLMFRQLADEKGLPFIILVFTASAVVLRKRIRERDRGVSDADLSVLEQQLIDYRPLKQDEAAYAIDVDVANESDTGLLRDAVLQKARQQRGG